MEQHLRKVKTLIEPKSVMEGAGVKLKRGLGSEELNYLDPFLLFDHFFSSTMSFLISSPFLLIARAKWSLTTDFICKVPIGSIR